MRIRIFSSTLLTNQRGIALLYLFILFILLGVLLSAGTRMIGSTVTLGKIRDTKAMLERDVETIMAWAAKKGRLPTSDEYPGIFGSTPLDSWNKPIVFAYYSSLTKISTGGLCGRTNSSVTCNGQDIAFLLLSGGEDMSISSTPGTSGVFNGILPSPQQDDLCRIVTLKELQTQAGCFGATTGGLRIVNNEQPGGCIPQKYLAQLFADGGVPPVSFSYTNKPSWLTPTGAAFATLSGNTSDASASSYTVSVTATDSAANVVKRSYRVNIMPSCN